MSNKKVMRRMFRSILPALLAILLIFPTLISEPESGERSPRRKPVMDIHIHLFGTGDSGSGCRLSKTITESFVFQHLLKTLEIQSQESSLDEAYVDLLVEELKSSGLDRGVLLAQDGVYDQKGHLDLTRTHVYVPNDYLFGVVSRYPDLFIPCPSINPNRRDCMEELERCHTRGARILKIHPPIQGVDISDPKHTRFFSRCTELGILVMVHTGHEHSAPVIDSSLADPRKLELALKQGCTVIACHSGSGWPGEKPDFLSHFVDMVRRHDRLWGDTSILGTPLRVPDVNRLLAEKDISPRLLHGSDFPFPSYPWAFFFQLGIPTARKIQKENNLLKRDLDLKAALGFGRESAERTYELLLGSRDSNFTRIGGPQPP